MNIVKENRAGTQETNQQEQRPNTAASQRHTDWISYAVAVTQQAQANSATYSSNSKF